MRTILARLLCLALLSNPAWSAVYGGNPPDSAIREPVPSGTTGRVLTPSEGAWWQRLWRDLQRLSPGAPLTPPPVAPPPPRR